MKRFSFIIVAVSVFVGCVSMPRFRAIQIDGLILKNQTSVPVENVMLYIEKTREFASCSFLLPGSSFSTTFPVRRYQGNRVQISWSHRGRKWSPKEFVIKPPENLVPGQPVKVLIVFLENGYLDPQMIQ